MIHSTIGSASGSDPVYRGSNPRGSASLDMKVFSSLFTNNVNASKCHLSSVVERLPEEQSVSGSIPLDGTSGNSASSFGVGAKCMALKRFARLCRPDAMKTT